MRGAHPVVTWRSSADPSALLPPVSEEAKPFWEALARREFLGQCCRDCGRFRHPVAPVCPYCDCEEFDWKPLSGRGRIFSWVRYHKSYLSEFEELMPYCVLTVELDEGVRMIARCASDKLPQIGEPVHLVIEKWPNGAHVPTFALGGE